MAKIDESVVESARNADLVSIAERYIKLQKHGKEYTALCPFHSETTPSFSINPAKNFYYCFGCGVSGNAISLVSAIENVGFREAVAKITGSEFGDAAISASNQRRAQKQPQDDEWIPVVPVPADLTQRPSDQLWRKGDDGWVSASISVRYPYFGASGELLGYTERFDLLNGKKEIVPQTFCRNAKSGELSWRRQSFGVPRPLYGLHLLARHPNALVVIVEGEKCVDAGMAIIDAAGCPLDKLICVSWPGGSKAVGKIDWSPLAGRRCALWPDADRQLYGENHPLAGQLMPEAEQPGVSAMLAISLHLEPIAQKLAFIRPPVGVPCGWDIADQGPNGFDFFNHIRSQSCSVDEFKAEIFSSAAPESLPEPVPTLPETGAVVAIQPADNEPNELLRNGYFTILGYDGGHYYFFQYEKRQVLTYSAGSLTDLGLIEIAPLNWWEMNFPANNGGIDKKRAANWIFRTANARGIYDPSKVRGRGAWVDRGRQVFHHGGHLTVDGQRCEITEIKSAYVYPMTHSVPDLDVAPMTDAEGRHLLSIAGMVRWSMPASSALMAGWTMLAPIGGALVWRPHIWITGAAGSGKSTIQRDFCASLTRGFNVYGQGNSTEPGVRQNLKADALPVLIDEAESNTDSDKHRITALLSLIRQTSSECQAKTLKGSADGRGQDYQIRSMFCLASINVNLQQKADIDRVTRLVIRPPASNGSIEHWHRLEELLKNIDQDETISSRLLARALSMLPIILESVRVFRRVAAAHFGTQRDGDQFGTLLAGAWCLTHSRLATDEDAARVIESYDWTEHTEDHDQDDAKTALSGIMGAKIRVGGGSPDQTVYSLIREVCPSYSQGMIDVKIATDQLRANGIRISDDDKMVLFGTNVPNLKTLIEGAAYVTDIRGQLMRLPGVTNYGSRSVRFNGQPSKCVAVPLSLIMDGSD